MIAKMLYLQMLIGQYFVMTYLLGLPNVLFGWRMLVEYWHEDEVGCTSMSTNLCVQLDWTATGLFPRVTLCDFEVRVLSNIHRYTVNTSRARTYGHDVQVQCVLMINMFNEKIFMLLWLWFAVMLVCCAISCVYWTQFFVCSQGSTVIES
jgi:hypothetical protein